MATTAAEYALKWDDTLAAVAWIASIFGTLILAVFSLAVVFYIARHSRKGGQPIPPGIDHMGYLDIAAHTYTLAGYKDLLDADEDASQEIKRILKRISLDNIRRLEDAIQTERLAILEQSERIKTKAQGYNEAPGSSNSEIKTVSKTTRSRPTGPKVDRLDLVDKAFPSFIKAPVDEKTSLGSPDGHAEVVQHSGIGATTAAVTDKDDSSDIWRRGGIYRLLAWVKRMARPRVRHGYKRIEWTCDCGVELYGDFLDDDNITLDALQNTLKRTQAAGFQSSTANVSTTATSQTLITSSSSNQASLNNNKRKGNRGSQQQPSSQSSASQSSSSTGTNLPKFLALCINAGGRYKKLAELDVSAIHSDAEAFLHMKKAYHQYRGLRSRLTLLLRPVSIEFVQFTLWNLRNGYISVCDRPLCVPPETRTEYDYLPRPLRPLPPMPPDVFIHYLEHGEGDLSLNRCVWLPRLPKRTGKGVVQLGEAADGWGIHIIEGPNREVVFWVVMGTMLASALTGVLWAALMRDVQGGMGIGALMMAMPPAVMAAFLFRLGGP